MDSLADQKKLIDCLVQQLKATEGNVSQFETHISRVLVAGQHAYKFKKALRLPFLDFSTLQARHFYCQEECRLNRRLAPHIYLDTVSVTGDPAHPAIGGEGDVIEYAVRMHAFAQQALWSYRVRHGLLAANDIDDLAPKLAHFHLDAAIASKNAGWGTLQTIAATADETLAELAEQLHEHEARDRLAALQNWERAQRLNLADAVDARKAQGMVRECHGDLHCGNIVTTDWGVEVFDCIEFNDRLRWIDVMSDLAFVLMELRFRRRADLAARLLNQYLEITGDYPGLNVLRYYQVHRALVRAKVMLLRANQSDMCAQDREECQQSGLAYLAFAQRCSQHGSAAIMITHGYSGSGKTTFARDVVALLGAVQLRSDVERKRMHGLSATSRPGASSDIPLYAAETTRITYERLLALARAVAQAGWPVIVDAACLKRSQRTLFHALAIELGVPFFIFDIRASQASMKSRIVAREAADRDASDAGIHVLVQQLRHDEPLTAEEAVHTIMVDMEGDMDRQRAKEACLPVLTVLHGA